MKIDPRTVVSHSFKPATPEEKKARDLERLRETCHEFESILVMEMYKSMRKAVPDGGLFEKSIAKDTYQEMFDMEVARQTASGSGIGIAEAIYRQMADQIENKKYE